MTGWTALNAGGCSEPRAGVLSRDGVRQAAAEQLYEQLVGRVDAVGVLERVEIQQKPAYHGQRERCGTPGLDRLGTVDEKPLFEDGQPIEHRLLGEVRVGRCRLPGQGVKLSEEA